MADYGVVVLTGGTAARFGSDKTSADLHGSTLLDHVLAGIDPEVSVVVVGERRETSRSVRWTREQPPGSGPLAGICTGAALIDGPITVVLAADMPFVGGVAATLAERLSGSAAEAAVPIDAEGRRQPLAAAYRTARLLATCAETGGGTNRAMRELMARLRVDEVPASRLPPGALLDVDTRSDLAGARRLVAERGTP